ncbi:hypothetical protein GCM10027076_28990 [Nocardioides montaniterrae]
MLTGSGGLTDSDRFKDVVDLDGHHVAEALYVDLHSGLVKAALRDGMRGEDERVADNLRHLLAVGLAVWSEDGWGHLQLRVSAD